MKTSDSTEGIAPSWGRKFRLFAFCLYAFCILSSQALMSIGAAILFVSAVAGAGGPKAYYAQLEELVRRPGIKGFFGLSMAFILVIVLSLVGTWLWPVTYDGYTAEVSLPLDIGKTWYFLAPFVISAGLLAMGESERRLVLRSWLLTFLAVSAIGVFQFFTGWPIAQVIPTHPEYFHAVIFLGHHLSASSVLVFPFFAAVSYVSRSDGWKSIALNRGLIGAIVVVGAITLFLTFSRALWGALPIALIVWSVCRFGKKSAWAAVAVVLGVGIATQIPAVSKRFTKGGSLSDREELWVANLDFFKARPVLGLGFRKNHRMSGFYLKQKYPKRTWIFAGHAHNNLLDMMGGLGSVGTFVWLLWCGWVVWLPYKAWRIGGEAGGFPAGLIAAWVAFQVNGVTQVNFWEGKVMHQMMWAAAWGIVFYLSAREGGRTTGHASLQNGLDADIRGSRDQEQEGGPGPYQRL